MKSPESADILDVEPRIPSATELLYNKYGGMLFSFILQFEADRQRAAGLLAEVFSKLHYRIEEACNSNQSLYCWLQAEARMIILESRRRGASGAMGIRPGRLDDFSISGTHDHYFALLREATVEQRWVFRELYIQGRSRDELAKEVNRDRGYIDTLLRESLLIIRKKLS